jgi:hypothetical protein
MTDATHTATNTAQARNEFIFLPIDKKRKKKEEKGRKVDDFDKTGQFFRRAQVKPQLELTMIFQRVVGLYIPSRFDWLCLLLWLQRKFREWF